METAIQCNDPHCLLLPRLWHYGLAAYWAAGSKLPVQSSSKQSFNNKIHVVTDQTFGRTSYPFKKQQHGIPLSAFVCLSIEIETTHHTVTAKKKKSCWVPVKVINTVDLRCGIHSKRHSIQATAANHTSETARVVSLSHRPQDPV